MKWSFMILLVGACVQLAIVLWSDRVGLFADTIHNFGDAGTAIPLRPRASLARVSARVGAHPIERQSKRKLRMPGGGGEIRTPDLRIMRPSL